MKNRNMNKLIMVLVLTVVMVVSGVLSASAALRTRIVVLPFYVEQGRDADTGSSDLGFHYRRMSVIILK